MIQKRIAIFVEEIKPHRLLLLQMFQIILYRLLAGSFLLARALFGLHGHDAMQHVLPTRFVVICHDAGSLKRSADQHHYDAEPQKDFEEETLHLPLANARLSVEISDAADAFDSLGSVFKQSNLLAQIAHMRIDAAIERREFAAEYIARQLLAANNLAGRLQQRLQQIEFYGGEIQDLVTAANNSGAAIHFDIPDDNWRRGGMAAVSYRR